MRRARDAVAALINARRPRMRSCSSATAPRRSTSSPTATAAACCKPGQAVLISGMEHHSNIVPWQMLRDAHGIELRVAPITDAGELDMAAFEALLADGKVGLVAITHMSNVLGTVHAGRAHRAAWPTRTAPRCCSTARRRWCIAASTCRRSTAISTPSPATSCTARPASACCGRGASCWSAMPPFMGGGEMISSVTLRARHLGRGRRTSSRPARRRSSRRSACKAAIDYVQRIGYDGDRGA